MKQKLSVFLCAALTLSLLAGCGPKTANNSSGSTSGSNDTSQSTSQSKEDRTQVDLMVLSGPTGVGAAKLLSDNEAGTTLNDYNAEVVTDNSQIQTALTSGEVDIAAIATNVAANLSAQTDGSIQMLAVNTLGVLYILDKNVGVTSLADLSGKTIYATGKGANPEYILNYLLTENGVDPANDVTIEWLTAEEVSAKMISSDSAVCMLPVPAATALMTKDSAVQQAISLSDAWDELGNGSLAMGCVVARTEFIEENPQAVADFLTEYEASINYMKDEANVETASELVAQYKITPSAAIAAAAIPQCNLTFASGQEMKDLVEGYFSVLFQAAPASIGGGMPYDSFYYGLA